MIADWNTFTAEEWNGFTAEQWHGFTATDINGKPYRIAAQGYKHPSPQGESRYNVAAQSYKIYKPTEQTETNALPFMLYTPYGTNPAAARLNLLAPPFVLSIDSPEPRQAAAQGYILPLTQQ